MCREQAQLNSWPYVPASPSPALAQTLKAAKTWPQVLTFLSGAGTKLRNSSTWPTASQSTKSSTRGCTFWAWRKFRTTWVTLRPLDLGQGQEKMPD